MLGCSGGPDFIMRTSYSTNYGLGRALQRDVDISGGRVSSPDEMYVLNSTPLTVDSSIQIPFHVPIAPRI